MRWVGICVVTSGLMLIAPSSSHAQGWAIGDVAGFGRWGVSNGFGYSVNGSPNQGYYTGLGSNLYAPGGPSMYYGPEWNGLNGYPRPDVATRGWGYSPPWSASYRQGEPKKHRLLSRLHHRRREE